MKFFRVRNYEKFQHYKDRNPPWIKLYNSLLDDPRFFQLQEADRYILLGLFLLASRTDNCLPNDQAWLKPKLLTKRKVPIELLVAAEWLEWAEETGTGKFASAAAIKHASKTASAAASTVASTNSSLRALARAEQSRIETETEGETEKSSFPQITQTLTVNRSTEEDDRTDPILNSIRSHRENRWQKYWGPVEKFIRKCMTEDQFRFFYHGIEIREMTSTEVVLAVPAALIQAKGGIANTALILNDHITGSQTNFMRDRILRVVDQDQIGGNA